MNKIFKAALTTVLAIMLVGAAAACNNEAVPVGDIITVKDTASDTINDGTVIDFDKLCSSIKIADKEVKYPFTLNDLSQEYALDESGVQSELTNKDTGEYLAVGDIKKGDDVCFDIGVTGITVSSASEFDMDHMRNGNICYLHQTVSMVNKTKVFVEINGIKIGDKIDKVIETLGQPSAKKEQDGRIINCSYYGNAQGTKSIKFISLTTDNVITSITFDDE